MRAKSARIGFSSRNGLPSTSTICLPFSTRVPRPVAVRTPPKPTPPARMRSISVPWGTSSTSISPAIIFACVSGLRPMCEAITFATAPALISLPIPLPGIAVSLAMMVRFFAPRLTKASISLWGEPTPMNPPIKHVAPSGISAAAASALIATFICVPHFSRPGASHVDFRKAIFVRVETPRAVRERAGSRALKSERDVRAQADHQFVLDLLRRIVRVGEPGAGIEDILDVRLNLPPFHDLNLIGGLEKGLRATRGRVDRRVVELLDRKS